MNSDVYNTTVNVNGSTLFSSTYSPCTCNGCYGGSYMNSCFGFGYNGYAMMGMGLGYALGVALTPLMPSIFKGIGNGCKWLGTKVIAPAATAVWKGVTSAAKWVWNGVSNVWNSIFHKKSKTEKAEKE